MAESKELICIVCPIGCRIKVGMSDGKLDEITGNSCKRGAEYAAMECMNPVRTLTGTVRIAGCNSAVIPVKSDKPLPKDKIVRCMSLISDCRLEAPVRIGDIIVENILDTGVNIVATRNMI